MTNDTPKPLIEHIIELRSVLLTCFVYIITGMVVSILFADYIFQFLMKPLTKCVKESSIVYTSITEPIATELRIAFYSSILLSFPFIVRKIWTFISIGLKSREILFAKKYGCIAILLFGIGIIFAYYIAIPTIVNGLSSWSVSKNAVFLPKMSDSISFVLLLMLAFGLSFQIPIVMLFLDKTGICTIAKQSKCWREYIAAVTIISAIIAPPDALSMIFMAGPLIILFIVTILLKRRY